MLSLKIEKNPFILATVDEYTRHIPEKEYKSFMSALFGTQHSYLNGLDRVAKVAESFKPVQDNSTDKEANRLIDLVRGLNDKVYRDAEESGRTFDDQLSGTSFKGLDERDNAILSNVKPHYSLKLLIAKINTYGTTLDALTSFKQAIESYNNGHTLAIDNKVTKMIGR